MSSRRRPSMPGSTSVTRAARARVPSTESITRATSISSAAARRSPAPAASRAATPTTPPLAVKAWTPQAKATRWGGRRSAAGELTRAKAYQSRYIARDSRIARGHEDGRAGPQIALRAGERDGRGAPPGAGHLSHHARRRRVQLGAQVLDVPLPLRDRLLRHGVHVRGGAALRHRPLRLRAASLLPAPGRPDDGRRHHHPPPGA